jgi:N-acetylglucosaminyldiphosphoundecaprenol N-acetyl-beta-D-mannosaminyltransferase
MSDPSVNTAPELERVNVLGVGLSVLNQDKAREILFAAARDGKRGYVAVTGVHGVMEAQSSPGLRHILNEALLCTPDGMPMVWLGKLKGHREMDRVYGPDLMLNLCQHSPERGFSHFLYGGNPGVADDLKRTLEGRFPGLKIVGTYQPPFRPLDETERADLARQVAETRPDFFWVGLSTPKQEKFMAEYLPLLPEAKVFLGVGAAFDLLTGRIKQAPGWMQRNGLEWFFRLIQEPKRLARRYLINNPLFVWHAAMQLLGARQYTL